MAMAKESMAKTLREIADALESEVVKPSIKFPMVQVLTCPAACSEALAKRLPPDQPHLPLLPSAGEVTGDHAGPCKGWYLLVDNAEIK